MSNFDNLELSEDKILFIFDEDIENKKFSNVTKSGIIVQERAENQLEKPRLGWVKQIGPDVKDVQVGDLVLIEPLRWTTGIEVEEVSDGEFWITDEKSIMGIMEQ
jgi:co-chaperonin GroES (HSP10)